MECYKIGESPFANILFFTISKFNGTFLDQIYGQYIR